MALSTRALTAQAVGVTPTRPTSASKRAPLAAARPSSRAAVASSGSMFLGAALKAPVGVRCAARAASRSLRLGTCAASIADFTADSIDGAPVAMSAYVGKVCLVVNVASACGLTDQNYKELVTVYNKYKSQGFEVLAFPCNQFGGQEPGSDAEVKAFAARYGAKFPMFSKIEVNGSGSHPLFKYLRESQGSFLGMNGVKWNFEKFLVDKTGKCVKRYAPTSSPLSIVKDIEGYL